MTKKLFSYKTDLFPLLKLAIPLALTGIVQSSTYFFETMFLAHLGKDVLAAGSLVGWLFATISVVMFGTLCSINILVSHKFGEKDHASISFIMRDGLLLAAIFSVVCFLLCWNMAPVFLFFGQPQSVVVLVKTYLHALSWGIPPSLIMIAIFEFLVGLGRARTVMTFSIFAVTITIFFSFALIFGKFGFPALGIAGAGWGVTLSNILTVSALLIYVLFHKNIRQYFHAICRFQKPGFIREILHIGVPIGLMYSVEVGFFFALTLLMGTLGVVELAANQVALQYMGLLMSIIFSIAQAITVRMGHLIGAREYHSVGVAAYLGAALSASLMFVVALFFWIFPDYLISIDFNMQNANNDELFRLTKQILIISPIFQILEAIRISLFGALRACKDTRFTLFISILSFWGISLPVGYLLANKLQLGGVGMWWAMNLGVITSVVLLFWRLQSRIRISPI